MINFHKYGFLDVKKLQRYTENHNFWLCRYNPIWLFIWKDTFKPEIAYDNEFCFIRYLMPEIGMCYYPPFGENLEKGLQIIKQDCIEHGFDMNIAPIDENMLYRMDKLDYDLKENKIFSSYIYILEDLAFFKNNKIKKQTIKKFEKEHPSAFYKVVKKEDFPAILEFIEQWRQSQNVLQDQFYFARLNSIKCLMEHLYEFDLMAIMLQEEEKIYGIAIGSKMENMVYLHLNLALDTVVGAPEELIACFCRNALRYARFLNMEEDMGNKEVKKMLQEYKPYRIEAFYSTFRL